MKNLGKSLKAVVLVVLLCLTLPLTMLFSGCGATAANEANAVNFVSENYDSHGRAIFEVDLNTPTKLTYKVNPSSWSGYAVTYNNDATERNRQCFVLENGVITVTRSNFEDLDVEINVNGHSDHCVVRLKKYPVKIYSELSDVQIAAQGMHTINVMAEFDNESSARRLAESEYKFKVVSSDETKIQVPNSERLTIYAVGETAVNESVKVTVSLLDQSGNEKTKFEINVNVVRNASEILFKIGGIDKFVKNGSTLKISAANLEKQNGAYILRYNVYFFSDSNSLLENKVDLLLSFSDEDSVSADLKNNKILIKTNLDLSQTEFSFNVSVITNLVDSAGNPLKLTFKVDLSA